MNPEDLTLSKTKVKKKVESEHRSVVSDSLRHHGLYSPRNSPGQNTGVGSLSLPNPGIKPRSPALQADSLAAEPQGKPKNIGVGTLSFLQGIVPTLGTNPGLMHCRAIRYQLNHKGSPRILEWVSIPSPGDVPDPGIKPGSPALQADSLLTELSGKALGNKLCGSLCKKSSYTKKEKIHAGDSCLGGFHGEASTQGQIEGSGTQGK